MEAWKKEMLKNSMVQDVIADYRDLLSVGKSDSDAESIIISHYMGNASLTDVDSSIIWIALAIKQWELGRLSANVKGNAISRLNRMTAYLSKETIEQIRECLLLPLPPKKKISRPRWISKCPWPVGSLLAYRITSTTSEKVMSGPYWKKYVLLRVIMIKKHPITRLSPDSEWRESMIVGLYNWYGDSIPNPEIAQKLSFTPILIEERKWAPNVLTYLSHELAEIFDSDTASSVKRSIASKRVETCASLDWKCVKGIDAKEVFTYLGCDSEYGGKDSDFFQTDISQYSITHSCPFDVMLANRFAQLAEE